MRKGMAVLAIGVLLAVAACSDDGDGKAATGPTEQVANKKDTTTTEPKDVTNAAALAMKGSEEIDPSPDDPLQPGRRPQDLRGRADRGEAGPEQHLVPGRPGPEARGERLDRPHGAQHPS